jgi:hypothetical protein
MRMSNDPNNSHGRTVPLSVEGRGIILLSFLSEVCVVEDLQCSSSSIAVRRIGVWWGGGRPRLIQGHPGPFLGEFVRFIPRRSSCPISIATPKFVSTVRSFIG